MWLFAAEKKIDPKGEQGHHLSWFILPILLILFFLCSAGILEILQDWTSNCLMLIKVYLFLIRNTA